MAIYSLPYCELRLLVPVKIKIKGKQYASPFYMYEWRVES